MNIELGTTSNPDLIGVSVVPAGAGFCTMPTGTGAEATGIVGAAAIAPDDTGAIEATIGAACLVGSTYAATLLNT